MIDSKEILKRKAAAKLELMRRTGKDDFWTFCLYMNYDFFNSRRILKLIALAFQNVSDAYDEGYSMEMAASLPPRAGKSYITSLFAAWMLGRNPIESVMRNACTATLYEKFSYDTRDIVRSERFQSVFPEVMMREDKQAVRDWSLQSAQQVSYFGAGVGGTIIGFGASMLAMTDDLYKGLEEALSENNNEKTHMWKDGAHDSRLEKHCAKIDIGTRWIPDDVIGRAESQGKYDLIVRIPALINGETFCEAVHTTKYYLNLQQELNPEIFAAEYMQEPIELKGLLFPKSELNWFTMQDIQGRTEDASIGATDTADTGADYFSSPFAKKFGEKYFIHDVIFTTDAVEITEGRLIDGIKAYKVKKQLIESNNGGRIFANNVKRGLGIDLSNSDLIITRHATTNKETRIFMNASWIKRHFYFRSDYKKGGDYDKFIINLTKYLKQGGNKHDDAADSLNTLKELIEILEFTGFKESKNKTIDPGNFM